MILKIKIIEKRTEFRYCHDPLITNDCYIQLGNVRRLACAIRQIIPQHCKLEGDGVKIPNLRAKLSWLGLFRVGIILGNNFPGGNSPGGELLG